jgi:hypothetical protein
MEKGQCEIYENGIESKKTLLAWRESEKIAKWKTLPTFVEALEVHGNTIHGEHSSFIHKFLGNRDFQQGTFPIGHASIGPQSHCMHRERSQYNNVLPFLFDPLQTLCSH